MVRAEVEDHLDGVAAHYRTQQARLAADISKAVLRGA